MKFKLIILSATTLLFASGCSTMYAPALYHQDIAYQPKPTSVDKSKTATYTSLGLNNYINLDGDLLSSGQVNMSVGHVFNHLNIAYGTFGVVGNYLSSGSNITDHGSNGFDPDPSHHFNDKFFGAVGGRFSANAFIKYDNMDFRFIGMEAAYSHEFGEYANYRQQLFQHGRYVVDDPRTNLYTIGLTSEIIFHGKNSSDPQHAIRGFIGATMNNKEQSDFYYKNENAVYLHDIVLPKIVLFSKLSYFLTYKKYIYTAEIGDNFNLFLRFGYKF